MLKNKFQLIADRQNTIYALDEFKVNGINGSKVFISIHTFKFIHKNVEVLLKYELGNSNLAEIKFTIPNQISAKDFKLETKEHIFRIFSANKDLWKIKGEDKLFISKVKDALNSSGLSKLADKTSFEPYILGKNSNNNYTLNTTFSLSFENYDNSIEPIIDFHKQIIDLLNF